MVGFYFNINIFGIFKIIFSKVQPEVIIGRTPRLKQRKGFILQTKKPQKTFHNLLLKIFFKLNAGLVEEL